MSKKHRSSSGGVNLGTGQRSRKKSKKFNTESEEYDSLNSDSDTVSRELDATSRTESSNCLDDTGPVNFSSEFDLFVLEFFTKSLQKPQVAPTAPDHAKNVSPFFSDHQPIIVS
jgi:hypothetical protein